MAAMVAEPQPPPPSHSPPPPCTTAKTILERYQQGKLLGRGSFAKVYHARSLTTHKSVAIKVIDKSKTHPSMAPRIVGEVAAMRRLNHPNILKIHEVLATKSKIYLVMELAKGGDLFGKLSRRPEHRFPEPLARKYFHQLVSALQYCHQNGVAHRDVKPQNLLLDEEGNIKVSDFGLSAVAESVSDKELLLQTSCGTPAFAAPEIVGKTRNGYDGAKADAWSCGVILFVMLTGYLPFDDANLVMMYRKMHKREFRFPSWVSKPARGLITKLLDPNPKTRMSIESIGSDNWFKNFGMVYPRSVSLGDLASLEEKKYEKIMLLERSNTMTRCDERGCGGGETMNAFELIALSNGLDLSGLFDQDRSGERREKKFTSRESRKVVVEKVGEVGEVLGYEVEKREKCGGASCCVWLGKGRFILSVTVSEVAAELVVVEMKVVDGSGVGWIQEEVYWEQLKSGLGDIVVSWHQ